MGKGARIKQEREAAQQPKVLNTLAINILEGGNVNVSGPITDPVLVMDVLGKALNALAMYHAQKRDQEQGRIIQAQPKILMPS